MFKNLNQVLERSKKIGLKKILTISTSLESYKNILKIVDSIEVLSHLSVTSSGVLQLAEIRLKDDKTLEDISEISWLEVVEVLEEEEDSVVVSLLCTHSFAKSAIELSNIQVYPPYGIDSVRGMEIRMSGLSDSVRRFVSILRVVLPPDKISVNSIRDSERNGWTDGLTEKQKEVISYAIGRG